MFCYYVVLAAVSLTAFTLSIRELSTLFHHIVQYYICEQGGHDPDAPCSRAAFEALQKPGITTLSYILLGLFPVVNLVYALNVQELREMCRCVSRKKDKFSISDNPSTGSSAVNSSTLKRV